MTNKIEQQQFINYHERLRMLLKESEDIRQRLDGLELSRKIYESLYNILETLDHAVDTNPRIANPDELVLREGWLVEAFLESFEQLFESLLKKEEVKNEAAC